jgi:hypothetical protein
MVRASPETLPYQEFLPYNASYLNSFRNYRSNPNKENFFLNFLCWGLSVKPCNQQGKVIVSQRFFLDLNEFDCVNLVQNQSKFTNLDN